MRVPRCDSRNCCKKLLHYQLAQRAGQREEVILEVDRDFKLGCCDGWTDPYEDVDGSKIF